MIIALCCLLWYLVCWRWSTRRLIEKEKKVYPSIGIDSEDVAMFLFLAAIIGVVHGPYSLLARYIERRDGDPGETFVNAVEVLTGVDRPSRTERKAVKYRQLEQRNRELERELGLHAE